VEALLAVLSPAMENLSVSMGALSAAMGQATAAMGQATAGMGQAGGQAGDAMQGIAGAVGETASGMGGMQSSMNAVVGGMGGVTTAMATVNNAAGSVGKAFGSIEEPIVAMAGSMKQFVGALSPATVQLFDWALRELHATIGVALLPAFQLLTGLLRETAGVINPLMHALAPILERVIDALGGAFMAVIDVLTDALMMLTPVLDFLTDVIEIVVNLFKMLMSMLLNGLMPVILVLDVMAAVMKPLNEVLKWATDMMAQAAKAVQIAIMAVVQTIIDSLGAMFGVKGLKDTLAKLTEVVHNVIRAFILFTAYLAVLFGQRGYIDNLIKGLEGAGRAGKGEAAAPLSPSIKNIEQISKDLALASFIAGAGAPEGKSDREIWLSIANELKKMGGEDLEEQIKDAAYNALIAAWNKINEFLGLDPSMWKSNPNMPTVWDAISGNVPKGTVREAFLDLWSSITGRGHNV